jgi:hypothetical protein
MCIGSIVRSDTLITVGQLYLADYATDFFMEHPWLLDKNQMK